MNLLKKTNIIISEDDENDLFLDLHLEEAN